LPDWHAKKLYFERKINVSRVKIENDQLVISMQGARKFFALKSELSIDLENVVGVTTGLKWSDAPKLFTPKLGAFLAPSYLGGTFYQEGDKVFYDLRKKEEAVVISLKEENLKTLVIGVENPEETVILIEQALSNRK